MHLLSLSLSSHSSEKYWHDPEKFDPLRLRQANLDRLLPFSAGPRSCIGKNFAIIEAKAILALMIKHFSFELIPGRKYVPEIAISMR